MLKIARFNNWWSYKIPPLLTTTYYLLLIDRQSFATSAPRIFGAIISIIGVAIYGYIINDIFDKEVDQASGKPNQIGNQSPLRKLAWVIVSILIGFTPAVILQFKAITIYILIANYLLPTAYSIPPVRLKEKGGWGILSDALGVHAVPTLFIGTVMITPQKHDNVSLIWLIVFVLWAFAYGIRGIIIHQILDRQNDISAGTKTYILSKDPEQVKKFTVRVFFSIEIGALISVVLYLIHQYAAASVILLAYLIVELARYQMDSNASFDPIPATKGAYIFPATLYEVWMPLMLVAILTVDDLGYFVILITHIALFRKRITAHWNEIYSGIRSFTVRK